MRAFLHTSFSLSYTVSRPVALVSVAAVVYKFRRRRQKGDRDAGANHDPGDTIEKGEDEPQYLPPHQTDTASWYKQVWDSVKNRRQDSNFEEEHLNGEGGHSDSQEESPRDPPYHRYCEEPRQLVQVDGEEPFLRTSPNPPDGRPFIPPKITLPTPANQQGR